MRIRQAAWSVDDSGESELATESIDDPDLIPFTETEPVDSAPTPDAATPVPSDAPPASGPVAPALPTPAPISVPENPFGEAVDELAPPGSESPTDSELLEPPPVESDPPDVPAISAGALTADSIAAEIARVESEESIDAETRADLIAHYQQAADAVQAAQKMIAERDKILVNLQAMKGQAAGASDEFTRWKNRPALSHASDATNEQLKQQQTEFASKTKAAEEFVNDASTRSESAVVQRKAIETRLSELARALEEPATQISPDKSAEETLALTMEQNAVRQALRQQAELLQSQLQELDIQSILLKTQSDLETERLKWLRNATQACSEVISQRRTAEAQAQQAETNLQSYGIHPRLQKYADRNVELADRNAELADLIQSVQTEAVDQQSKLDELIKDRDVIQSREKETGLTNTLGLLMRNRRNHLPSTRPLRRQLRGIQRQMESVGNEEMLLVDHRDRFSEFESRIGGVVREISAAGDQTPDLDKTAASLIAARQELVQSTISGLQEYTNALGTVGSATNRLITASDDFAHYIDENVLWVRSTHRLGFEDLQTAATATVEVAQPANWSDVCLTLYASTAQNGVPIGVAGLVILLLFTFGAEIRNRLRKLGQQANKDHTAKGLLATAEAFVHTLLISLTRPMLLYAVGWLLSSSLQASNFAVSLGHAVETTAILFILLEVLRQICRQDGLAHLHFGWDHDGLKQIHKTMPSVMLIGLPMVMAVVFFEGYEAGMWKDSLGRMIFIVGMILLWRVLRTILHPSTGALQLVAGSGGSTWIHQTRHVWYVLANMVPLALAVLAFTGFYYTAEQLSRCLETTLFLSLVLTLVQAFLTRCIDSVQYVASLNAVSNDSTAVQELGIHHPEDQTAPVEINTSESAEQKYWEIVTNSLQIHRLLRIAVVVVLFAGVWSIWSSVLPAMTALADYPVWESIREVSVAQGETTGDSTGSVEAIRQTVPVTIGDLMLAFLIAGVAFIAARNLPGLLETLVLSRLPIDRGARHAVSMICCYVLTVAGFVFAFHAIGIGWSSVQWLVAAMTVGLGFGLQEIFANFVSGLIILFERPIRIGDFVTVANETGTVQRIQFRATTIQDTSRREIIVPNKKFITDQLVNWTLTDPITRIVVPVGVAYGTDTTVVRRLLLEIAEEHPMVLDTPESSAVMKRFGDSTLDFELRCFIPKRDEYAEVTHDLATAIDRRFTAANIEIAFPQRDLNIRGLDALGSAGPKLKAA